MKDLKQKLIDSEQVAFLPNEFDFQAKISDSCEKVLVDDLLPLQPYRINDNGKLFVVRPYLFSTLMSENQSWMVHRKIPMKTTD